MVEENRTTNKGVGSLTNEGLTQLLEIIQIGPDQSFSTEWPRKSTGTDQRRSMRCLLTKKSTRREDKQIIPAKREENG